MSFEGRGGGARCSRADAGSCTSPPPPGPPAVLYCARLRHAAHRQTRCSAAERPDDWRRNAGPPRPQDMPRPHWRETGRASQRRAPAEKPLGRGGHRADEPRSTASGTVHHSGGTPTAGWSVVRAPPSSRPSPPRRPSSTPHGLTDARLATVASGVHGLYRCSRPPISRPGVGPMVHGPSQRADAHGWCSSLAW